MSYIRIAVVCFIAFVQIAVGANWEPNAQRPREAVAEPANYGAWYHMPQPSAYPAAGYERAPLPAAPYAGYPRPYSRSPDYYPESAAVANNLVPGPRKPAVIASGYYPSAQMLSSTQDNLEGVPVAVLTPVPRPLPLQVVLMRVFQMVQYHLAHAAWEFEEIRRITEAHQTRNLFNLTPPATASSAGAGAGMRATTELPARRVGGEEEEEMPSSSPAPSTPRPKKKKPVAVRDSWESRSASSELEKIVRNPWFRFRFEIGYLSPASSEELRGEEEVHGARSSEEGRHDD